MMPARMIWKTDLVTDIEPSFTRRIKFSLLLSLQIPSILCYLFLLFHLLLKRSMRRSFNNHAFILLLFIGFLTVVIDLSMILDYLRRGTIVPHSPAYCLFWNFLNLFLYSLTNVLMLWASIERHILIFYKSILNSQRKRFLIHYVPLIILPIYLLLIYILIVFVPSCTNNFDSTQVVCGGLCYSDSSRWIETIDRFIHNIIPAFLIILSNVFLLGRVIWQNHYRMRLRIQWPRHRKLVFQILPISILYLCSVIPYGLITCINTFDGSSHFSIVIQKYYFFYLFYLLAELLPFAYLAGMPRLYSKLFCRRRTPIAPMLQERNLCY